MSDDMPREGIARGIPAALRRHGLVKLGDRVELQDFTVNGERYLRTTINGHESTLTEAFVNKVLGCELPLYLAPEFLASLTDEDAERFAEQVAKYDGP